MNRFSVSHEINCSVAAFWKLFLDKTFNESLYKDALKFNGWTQLDLVENDKTITRKCSGQPKVNMPGPVMKLMGSNFGYTEVGIFDKTALTWKWTLTPSALADRVKQEGTVRVESVGDGSKVRRTAELMIDAKVFGLGGIIESSAEKQLREGWDSSARFMNDYIAKHPA
jgi:Protein of unknown function (DUF2505)